MLECYFEDGVKARGHLRHVAVGTLVFNAKETEILLVKRAQFMQVEPGKWALPGGFLDENETVIAGAGREVKEETGYDLKTIKFFNYDDGIERGDNRQNVVFFFVAKAGRQTTEPDNENEAIKWWPLTALPPASEWGFNHLEWVQKYLASRVFFRRRQTND
jgi:ADP-ribose pyrophosphatase YjhB (NUDIX family)